MIDFPESGRDASKNKDGYAKQLIAREGPGILNWAVEGARQLLAGLQNGHGFILTPIQQNRVDDRINESDSLCVFLMETIERKQGSDLATQDIIDCYVNYSRARHWGVQNEDTLTRRLNSLMTNLFSAHGSNHVKPRFGQKECRGYTNVGWKNSNVTEEKTDSISPLTRQIRSQWSSSEAERAA